MKKLSNDKEYAENYKTYSQPPLAFSCAQVVFRAKYMLDVEHQFVASEIMSFSRALQTPERRPTFEKAISMDVHCMQEQEFR